MFDVQSTSARTAFDRRDVLKGAGIAVAGIAAGFAPLRFASAAEDENHAWTGEYDVVIVGAGGAGLSAAVEAAQAGARTLVVEHEGSPLSSNTALSGGVFMASECDVQERAGVQDSKVEFRKFIDFMSDGLADPVMMDIWVENCDKDLLWLEDLGVEFPAENLYYSSEEANHPEVAVPAPRGCTAAGGNGTGIVMALWDAAEAAGAEVMTKTTAQHLITDAEGRVIGVTTDAGDFRAARGVVLAAGGYSRNREWLAAFMPRVLKGGAGGGHYQQGDGIRMAWALGAKLGNMWCSQVDDLGTPIDDEGTMIGLRFLSRKHPSIVVDRNCQRRTNEDQYFETLSQAISGFEGGYGYTVWDQKKTDMGYTLLPVESPNCDDEVANGWIFRADTIEELAEQLGVDGEALAATLAHYNEMAETGVDADFGRVEGLEPIVTPPYYGAKVSPLIFDTAGGMRIDAQARVLDVWDEPICGLYAAGMNVAGSRGTLYTGCGCSVSTAVCFGRIAGRTAAAADEA